MKIVYIFNFILCTVNTITGFNDENYSAGLGWLCASLWLAILIIKEFKKD